MWRPLFSLFGARKSHRTARRRANPHRFSGRRPTAFAAERLEARWYLSGDPIVQVNTNFGNFQIELFPADAPQTVANFLSYVNSGRYNDVIVSRSVPGFVIQAGGITSPTATYTSNSQFVPVPQNPAIPLEYKLPNTAGTIAMARNSNVNSATDEWFINLVDNSKTLGPGGSDPNGYAAFGQVLGNGMQVVNSIAAVPTTNEGSIQTSPTSSTGLSNMPLGPNNQLVQITSMALVNVQGTVFTDINGNGTQDSGEPGLAGRTVFVDVDGSGQPDSKNPSAVTDANGNYSITGVPAGNYKVEEVLPSGTVATTSLQTISFTANMAPANVNFGEAIHSISGTVFTDINADGKLDPGDPGLAGRTVFIDNDGTGKPDSNNPSTTTDTNGNYFFSGLAAGTYKVSEVLPANTSLSTDTQSVVVTAGQTTTANIGEFPSIVGTVFNDLNVNGKLDAGEPGIAGVTVFLNNDSSGQPDSNNPSAVTDANGRFYFTGLAGGSYTVTQVLVANHGVTQTTATAAVTVGSGAPPTANIGDVLTSPLVPLPVGVNTQTPPSNANQAYIDDLYFTLLGRHAGSDGLAYWQQQMSGSATRAQVAQDIWDSTEHRQLEVEQYYHTYLNRAAEPGGLTFWVNRFINEGLTERQAAYFFTISPEYQADHKSDTDYINSLYQDVLLRTPSASELSGWQAAMSGGQNHFQVAAAFADGQEAAVRIVDAFYYNFLHRVPDSGAQSLITGLLADTTTAEKAGVNILASDEFFALAGAA